MRLLHRDPASGTIRLTGERLPSDIPPYAILSHRWGPDEVTFQDLGDDTASSKHGYDKIRFCSEQAWRDGLSYFWVDTCCIDKKNAVELQAAIISMFRWYRNASRCYVYLDDVSHPTAQSVGPVEPPFKKRRKHTDSEVPTDLPWHSALRNSLWFTRGWTLQELLAPASVEFFSKEHVLLGNKSSLERSICDVTRIPVEALRNCPLSDFSVSDRLSWMEPRETTLEEDKAYAMLGIFQVQMPLLYGEGYSKASERLRREVAQATRLPSIPVAEGASFDSRAEEHNARCYPNTRVDILRQIASWAADPDGKAVFWLNGVAGTGKSTISRTVAQDFYERGLLGASFFFKRGEAERGHAGRLFTTLAAQLAVKLPRVAQQIQAAVDSDPNVCSKALPQQFKELILHPLSNVHAPQTLVVVIDALDECDKDIDIRAIIHLLSQAKTIPCVRLRTFLTSRPELPIRLGFHKVQDEYQDLVLHQMPQQIVTQDLRVFFELELTSIHEEYNASSFEDTQLPLDWPSQHVDALVHKAYPLFIVAATICRFLDPTRFNPADQLQKLLDYQATTHTSDQLGSTYLPVVNQLVSNLPDVNRQYILDRFRNIVGAIILLAEPLSARALSRILHISLSDIQNQLKLLHSVLDIPSTVDAPVRTFHLSFRDFLLDPSRQDTHEFWINERLCHKKLSGRCMQLLSANKSLKKDICSLLNPGVSLSQVDRQTINRYLPPEVQYACLYWVHHLELGDVFIQDKDEAHAFLQTHFLHWLEALCLIGRIHNSIRMIQVLQKRCQPGTRIDNFLKDANRFIRNCIPIITQHPLQLYCSAISFAPQKGIIRQEFQKEMSAWIVKAPVMENTWNACTQTLEGHSHSIHSIAISPDSQWLASGSRDGVIKIWDVVIGACTQTFKSTIQFGRFIAISPDGRWLASGSDDRTTRVINIWDIATGACIQTLKGHKGLIRLTVISPNGCFLASISDDQTMKIWNIATGTCTRTLGIYAGWPVSWPDAIILPDSDSGSFALLWKTKTAGDIIEIRDVTTDTLKCTLELPCGSSSIAISPDSRWLASTDNATIRIWDMTSGTCIRSLYGHVHSIYTVSISPDSSRLASGSSDATINIWDIKTGTCTQTLDIGMPLYACSVGFDSNTCLRTPTGIINLGPATHLNTPISQTPNVLPSARLNSRPCYQGYGIEDTMKWITWNKKKVLWLPSEYRPRESVIIGTTIMVNSTSRRFFTLKLSTDNSTV
ncbi:vegetative incompatibility protein HET-E-1 [Xylaria cf. heliscus]|nr:vegetative incompatibility protein HET-E-1 [Xylaria cf. heliscus]